MLSWLASRGRNRRITEATIRHDLLLLSNSALHGGAYLEHALDAVAGFASTHMGETREERIRLLLGASPLFGDGG